LLQEAIRRSCQIKAAVVGADEREAGVRAHLNLGHTFGHAIETGMGYGAWLHGEAVATGMCVAASLSAALGLLPQADADRLQRLVSQAGLPTCGPSMAAADYLQHMALDKKADAGDIKYVLLPSLGRAVVQGAPEAVVVEVLRRYGAT
jgi:3-dehydroquinate synthetase